MNCHPAKFRELASIAARALCLVVIGGLAVNARAQEIKRPPSLQDPPTGAIAPVAVIEPTEDYRISPGDVIDIQIERAPELSASYRVTAGGTITMRYLNRIVVQQKTTEELATDIANALRGRYLKNPHVSVEVKQINSHVFFIQGAVRNPGVYQMEGRPSLLKLITIAGGLAENHGSTAFIIREQKAKEISERPEPAESVSRSRSVGTASAAGAESSSNEEEKYDLLRVNINGLFKGEFSQNMFVEPRDVVNIPQADVFFVAGEVQAPGSFSLKDGTTLRQAIALAQGTTFKAASNRGIIFRDNSVSGEREEIKVDISAVMSGKSDDLKILANDIIIVPNSRFKSVSATLLNTLGANLMRVNRMPY